MNRMFRLEHPNGKLNRKDFRKMISEALPKKDVSKMEKHVFRVYDTNGDGVIDFVEFMVVFHILSGEEQSSGSVRIRIGLEAQLSCGGRWVAK